MSNNFRRTEFCVLPKLATHVIPGTARLRASRGRPESGYVILKAALFVLRLEGSLFVSHFTEKILHCVQDDSHGLSLQQHKLLRLRERSGIEPRKINSRSQSTAVKDHAMSPGFNQAIFQHRNLAPEEGQTPEAKCVQTSEDRKQWSSKD